MARYVMAQLSEFGEVRRGTLGISVQDLTADLAVALDLQKGQGVLVSEVAEGSAAEKAGLQAGDAIRTIDSYTVRSAQEFHNLEGQFPVGETLALQIVRDQSEKTLKVKVEELQSLDGGEVDARLAGTRFEELPLKARSSGIKGVLISGLEPDSQLGRSGFRLGDIVTGCNRMTIQNLNEFKDVISAVRGSLFLEILRGGKGYVVRVD